MTNSFVHPCCAWWEVTRHDCRRGLSETSTRAPVHSSNFQGPDVSVAVGRRDVRHRYRSLRMTASTTAARCWGFKGHSIVLSPPFSLLSLHGGEIMHHSLVAEHEKCDGNFARLPCGGYRAEDREFVCVLWQIWAKLRAFRDERVLPGQLKLLFSTSTPADNGLLVAVSLYYKASSCLPSGFGECRSVMQME